MTKKAGRPIDVASNPEFLKEGAAIDDFMKPDRVVVGVRRPEAGRTLQELYAPFLRTERPFLIMSPESAEMTKYVANAMLATKISFINEMANLCEKLDADINDVRRGIGHDQRIGFQFLFPGPGYGGSCFPKDVNALIALAKSLDVAADLIDAVDRVNDQQKQVLPAKDSDQHFGKDLKGKCLGHLGPRLQAAHRRHPRSPCADPDRRDARGRRRISASTIPKRSPTSSRSTATSSSIAIAPTALEGADALAIVTEWQEFRHPDFEVMRRLMKSSVIFDGRNLYEPKTMKASGFTYYSIGRSQAPG